MPKMFKAAVFISSGHYPERLIINSCDYNGRHQFPPCEMGDLYSLDFAEFNYGNQIALSPTIFEKGASKVTKMHL